MCKSGQFVKAGEILATLRNPQLVQQYEDLELQIRQSDATCRKLQGEDLAAYQVEKRNRESLVEQRDDLQQKVEALTIRAGGSGNVIGRELDSLVGQYVETGSDVVGDRKRKRQGNRRLGRTR